METGLDPTDPGRAGRLDARWRERPVVAAGRGGDDRLRDAVKWSALWYVHPVRRLIFCWEVGARRSAGVPHPWRDTLLDETGWVVAVRLVIVAVYLASWTGWFATGDGWDRQLVLRDAPRPPQPPVIGRAVQPVPVPPRRAALPRHA